MSAQQTFHTVNNISQMQAKAFLPERMLFVMCKNTKNFGISGRYFEEYLKNILNR